MTGCMIPEERPNEHPFLYLRRRSASVGGLCAEDARLAGGRSRRRANSHARNLRRINSQAVVRTLTLCPNSLASIITDKTKAIIVTHLYGCMADIEAILKLAQARGI